jgi:hypothetical protein
MTLDYFKSKKKDIVKHKGNAKFKITNMIPEKVFTPGKKREIKFGQVNNAPTPFQPTSDDT